MSLTKAINNRNTQKRKLAKLKLRHNKNVNIFIGKKLSKHVKDLFFKGEVWQSDESSITVHYTGDPWLSGIMRDIGIFKSVSDAKGAGWHKKAERGFWHNIIKIGNKPHNVTIFKEEEKKINNVTRIKR